MKGEECFRLKDNAGTRTDGHTMDRNKIRLEMRWFPILPSIQILKSHPTGTADAETLSNFNMECD